MGNWSKQQKELNSRLEKDKTRKEKLAEYFFSLSNTVFGSLVIGLTLLMFDESIKPNIDIAISIIIFGIFLFIGFAKIGFNILK
mgnify:CR=1 FL=1